MTALAAIIGMAAHLEAKRLVVVDQLGMAQKGGGVYSHIRIGKPGEEIFSPRIGPGQADLLIASDMVVAHGKAALPSLGRGRTHTVVNVDLAPTSEFVKNNDVRYDVTGMRRILGQNSRTLDEVTAQTLAIALLGDAIYLNILLLGYAYQKGLMPLSATAIERAIELNGVTIEKNKLAFRWGRQFAFDPASVTLSEAGSQLPATTFAEIVARRGKDLEEYQSKSYAGEYVAFVDRIRAAEVALVGERDDFSKAVARSLYKLMAYKDEYEVARLYTDGRFLERLKGQFEGPLELQFHMAPPLLTKRDPDTGLPTKRTFGPWMLKALRVMARFKHLRGTALDPFGYTAERRTERALIAEYRATVEKLVRLLDGETYDLAAEIAALPLTIRGFGHVKERNLEKARERERALFERLAALGKGAATAVGGGADRGEKVA